MICIETEKRSKPARSPARPLADVHVVELANYMSVPFATMMLADLGADVVKVEPPSGDPFRRFGNSERPSPLFVSTNHGKRSVVLDLKDPGDQRRVRALLSGADVMVTNWRPDVAPRLGLDDSRLAETNPRLIRVYLSGFGATGPQSQAPTFDALIQAHLGSVSDVDPDASPTIASTYVVDKVAAAMVCQSILAALYARERSGAGTRLDLTLLDAAAYLNFPDLMANRTYLDHSPPTAVNTHAGAARAIRAADGWLVVMPVTGRQVRNAFKAVGAPEIAEEILRTPDATEVTRRMFDALEEHTRSGTVDEWMARFSDADVPAGTCLTIDQHLDDEQVRHNGTYGITEWADLGPVRWVRHPARSADWDGHTPPTAPPRVGAHTDEVLGRPRMP